MVVKNNVELERLNQVAQTYFKSLGNLAVLIGRSKQHLYSYKKRTGLGRDLIAELKTKLNINPRFIQYGEEPMILSSQKVESNVEEVGSATLTLLPDIRSLTPEQMKKILQWTKDNIPKIEKILETLEI
jgi:hypothetical protein